MEDTIAEKLLTIAENEQNVFNAGYEKGLASGGVTINNQDKTITENGVYQADEGYTGLGTVTVEVASTGGGDIVSRKLVNRTLSDYYVNDRVTSIAMYAFQKCPHLTSIDLPMITNIPVSTFADNPQLAAVILRSNTMCTLASVNAFKNTPIQNGSGHIYVPEALVDSYKTATNWSNLTKSIRAIEDYPEVCGGGK